MGKAEMEATHTQIYQACYLKCHNLIAPLCTRETAEYRSVHSQTRKVRLDQATFPGRDQTGHAEMESFELCQLLNTCPGNVGAHLATLHAATHQLRTGRKAPGMDFKRGNLKALRKLQTLGKLCDSSLDMTMHLF